MIPRRVFSLRKPLHPMPFFAWAVTTTFSFLLDLVPMRSSVPLSSLHDLPLGADTRREVSAMTLEVSLANHKRGGLNPCK